MNADWIFSKEQHFDEKALALFQMQAAGNPVYQRYLDAINCPPAQIRSIKEIPFLPIDLFKSFNVATGAFEPQAVFESSGTTGQVKSRHPVKDLSVYKASFERAFEQFYGSPTNWCILGLLPSYLERSGSSLVYMVQALIEQSGHPASGFYLYDFAALATTLQQLDATGQPVLLIGVTYALLDFAAAHPMPLKNTTIMETGGMKGRKKELLRAEVHALLQEAFGVPAIHSEYGMTELLSQAYARSQGHFYTPQWMKALIREEDDPFALHFEVDKPTAGALNIIDLANIHSCAFIATEDVARLDPDGSFEVLGRLDNSDIRGCSLMAL